MKIIVQNSLSVTPARQATLKTPPADAHIAGIAGMVFKSARGARVTEQPPPLGLADVAPGHHRAVEDDDALDHPGEGCNGRAGPVRIKTLVYKPVRKPAIDSRVSADLCECSTPWMTRVWVTVCYSAQRGALSALGAPQLRDLCDGYPVDANPSDGYTTRRGVRCVGCGSHRRS